MKYDPNKHHRCSHRIRGYDYTRPGAYFITINAHHREHLFGEIENGVMHLNAFGRVAEECWYSIADHFLNVELDEFVVMPDHIHGIFFIIENSAETYAELDNAATNAESEDGSNPDDRGATHASPCKPAVNSSSCSSPCREQTLIPNKLSLGSSRRDQTNASWPRGPKSRSVGAIVGSYKSVVSKRINQIWGEAGSPVWQRDYYEIIIRNRIALSRTRRYIRDNLKNWNGD